MWCIRHPGTMDQFWLEVLRSCLFCSLRHNPQITLKYHQLYGRYLKVPYGRYLKVRKIVGNPNEELWGIIGSTEIFQISFCFCFYIFSMYPHHCHHTFLEVSCMCMISIQNGDMLGKSVKTSTSSDIPMFLLTTALSAAIFLIKAQLKKIKCMYYWTNVNDLQITLAKISVSRASYWVNKSW